MEFVKVDNFVFYLRQHGYRQYEIAKIVMILIQSAEQQRPKEKPIENAATEA